ncbi:MAG: hypothetical protein QW579_02500 [Desulfurococcaceae archaeon]
MGAGPMIKGGRTLELLNYIFFATICAVIVLNPLEALSFNTIPPESDARAHIYRIHAFWEDFIKNKGLSLRQYNGMITLTYAPLFYAILFLPSLLTGPILAYKIGRVFTIVLYLLATAMLSRKLGFAKETTRIVMAILAFFPTVMSLYYSGAFPYLFSWSLTLMSFSILLEYERTHRKELLLASGLIGGLSVLSHSYGIINILLLLLAWFFASFRKNLMKVVTAVLAYLGIAFLVSLPYVVSMLLTLNDASPLYEYSPGKFILLLETEYLSIDVNSLIMALLCSYVVIRFFRMNDNHSGKQVIAYSLLLCTIFPLMSLALASFYALNMIAINRIARLVIPWRFLYVNCPTFLILSLEPSMRKVIVLKNKFLGYLTLGIILLVSLLANLIITSTISPYEKTISEAFPGLTEVIRNNRVLVVGVPLILTNSPVVFSSMYDYETSTGSYNQGDPAFFDLTVYYEWVTNLVKNQVVLENILELTRSNYIFTDLDIGVNFIPISEELISSKCSSKITVLTDFNYHGLRLQCSLNEHLVLEKFNGILIRLPTAKVHIMRVVVDQRVEMVILYSAIDENNTLHIFQLPHFKLNERVAVKDIIVDIGIDKSLLNSSLDIENVEMYLVSTNLVKVANYHYRGYKFTLYEYRRKPPVVISSKVVVFDTDPELPRVLTLLAPDGHKIVFLSVEQDIPKDLIAGVITTRMDKADEYVKNGYRTILLTSGNTFNVRNQTELFAIVETPLISSRLLPYDPGNPYTYSKWDRNLTMDNLQRVVLESSRLLSFIKEFMEIRVEEITAFMKSSPPELHIEVRKDRVYLVKLAYASHWRSNARLLRSPMGFIVVVPEGEGEVKVAWNPPMIQELTIFSIVASTIVVIYIILHHRKKNNSIKPVKKLQS